MHDLKLIREDPAAFDAGQARRGNGPQAEALLALDTKRRQVLTELQALQTERNEASKAIGKAKAQKNDAEAEAMIARVSEIKAKTQQGEDAARATEEELHTALAALPNTPFDDVPEGEDETGNVERRRVGEPAAPGFDAKEHFDVGEGLGLLDFEAAAKLSGARFAVLRGGLARLERALAQFMLDLHTGEFGYQEVSPPLLVRDEAMFGTGQLPKFREDQFRAGEEHWLVPTAEVPLTNLVRESLLSEDALPLRLTAFTPCFRREAGSAGKDTRGLIRLHQFPKVELVSITTPEAGPAEHERMTACAEEVLKRLELPYRVMELCTGDLGFSARRTFDLEVWLPGQKAYREISSCSLCGDFQARRMNARYRPAGEKKATRFVHTLNGSGVAVGRALVAVLETYQNEDGSVSVPTALEPYMGGLTRLEGAAPQR